MTDEPTNEWAEELNERYLRQEKRLMKDNELIEEQLKKLKLSGMGGIARIHVRLSLEQALETQREEIKGMIEDMRNRNAYLGNDKYFAGILQGQDQIIYDIIEKI